MTNEAILSNMMFHQDSLNTSSSNANETATNIGPSISISHNFKTKNYIINEDEEDDSEKKIFVKQVPIFYDYKNYISQSSTEGLKQRCPYSVIGCTTKVSPQNEDIKSHLHTEIHQHNYLLINLVMKMKTEILQSKCLYETKSSEKNDVKPQEIQTEELNHSNKISLEQLRKESVRMNDNVCELAKLIKELKLINDTQISQLREIATLQNTEIEQLKSIINGRLENCHCENEIYSNDNNEQTIQYKTNDVLSDTNNILSERAETFKRSFSTVQCLISDVCRKRKQHGEIWSDYFKSPCKNFTLRVWVHLRDVNNYSVMVIELLVWKNEKKSEEKFLFEGNVVISIMNTMKKDDVITIRKYCTIEPPNYSELFHFQYSDLKRSRVLLDDSVTIECMVL